MNYAIRAREIIGYSFGTERFCPSCISGMFHDDCPGDCGLTTEQILNEAAYDHGVTNREDESSFDYHDFPKVILANQVHDRCTKENGYEPGQCGDRCSCGEPLGFECPNAEGE